MLSRMMPRLLPSRFLTALLLVMALLVVYVPTLQTIPNGSDHYYMIDVGETQVVLNVWGTLHPTGYPVYLMTGGALVALFRLFGANPALAASLVSLVWGLLGLLLLYNLARHLTKRSLLAAALALVYGLTRTVWIHADIAEIYSFGLVLLLLLLTFALWQPPIRGRIGLLALLGGLAVAHHRAMAMAAPALVLAVWPDLVRTPRTLPRRLLSYLLLGLAGFLPYIYLPLRAWAGAGWVYGDPGTWQGFWDQFMGTEASRFIGAPSTTAGLLRNVEIVNTVLVTDLTLPGIVAGVVGLVIGILRPERRRTALVFVLLGLASYAFHAALYTDVLSALILQITVSLAFGWLFLVEGLIDWAARRGAAAGLLAYAAAGLAAAGLGATLFAQNAPFITELTRDPTGLDTIALAEQSPPGSTLMIAWGHHHFAVGYARDVLGELPGVELVDHNADFARIVRERPLITPDFTFYERPISWWQDRIGAPVYIHAVAPSLIEIGLEPEAAGDVAGLDSVDSSLTCSDDQIQLHVTWAAPQTPGEDLSVFVHLLAADSSVLAQADQSAPVYGWRPLTSWMPGEAVRDIYVLPWVEGAAAVRYGLYHQRADGSFENLVSHTILLACAAQAQEAGGA